MPDLQYDSLIIALGVIIPGAILAGPGIAKKLHARAKVRQGKEDRRDEILEQVADTLKELSGDVKCLFSVNASQLEALEVTLLALKGEHLNGNVSDALERVREHKKLLRSRLEDKVGCLGGAD